METFDLVQFYGPTTFYVVDSFHTLEEAVSKANKLQVGFGLQVEFEGNVVWSLPGPTT